MKSQKTFAAGGHRLTAARFRKEKNTMAEFRKNIEAKQSMAEERRNLKKAMAEIQKDVLQIPEEFDTYDAEDDAEHINNDLKLDTMNQDLNENILLSSAEASPSGSSPPNRYSFNKTLINQSLLVPVMNRQENYSFG